MAREAIFYIVIVNIIISILCIKWRKISNLLIYLEILTRFIALFFPNSNYYNLDCFDVITDLTNIFAWAYCGDTWSLYALTMMGFVQNYFGIHVIYLKNFGLARALINFIFVMFFFLLASFFVSCLWIISNLQI